MLTYTINYNEYTGKAQILQNGAEVGDYSNFRRCIGIPLLEWYEEFPYMCDSEANGEYEVEVSGGKMILYIISAAFEKSGTKLCKAIKHRSISRRITDSQRMKWLDELGIKISSECGSISIVIGCGGDDEKQELIGLLQNNKFLCGDSNGILKRYSNSPIKAKVKNGFEKTDDILFINGNDDSIETDDSCFHLVISVCNSGWFISKVDKSRIYVECQKQQIGALIDQWFIDIIFPELCKYIQDVIKNSKTFQKLDKYEKEKLRMLTSDKPFIELDMPSRAEMSETPLLKLIKIPDILDTSINVSDHRIVSVNNNMIKPLMEGTTFITVSAMDGSGVSVKKQISIFKYRKVTNVQLKTSKNVVKTGEEFTVSEIITPSNANNIGNKKVTITPSGIIQSRGNGRYCAVKPGNAVIRVEVDGVAAEAGINAYDAPKNVKFDDPSYSVRNTLGKLNIHASIFPVGCTGGNVSYRVRDTSIVEVDDKTGKVTTKREGKTTVYAILTDSSGALIDETSCDLIVKPMINELIIDEFLLAFIAFTIGLIFFHNIILKSAFGVAGLVSIIFFGVKNKKKVTNYVSLGLGLSVIFYMIYVFMYL